MTLHTTNILPFSGKGQSTDDYRQKFSKGNRLIPETRQDNYLNDQQFSSYKLIPVTSQENHLWMSDCRLIPETSHENYLHEEIED